MGESQPSLKRLHRCQRCGGQVLDYFDHISCLQCGAAYTKDYRLTTRFREENPEELPDRNTRHTERKRPYYH